MMWRNPLEPRNDLNKDDESDPFGRVAPKAQPESELANLGDASKLSQPVGEKGKNDRHDVAKVETMLGRTGALNLKKTDGPTGNWGERTKEATRAFQKQHGLKVDGRINPGGETIRTLAKVAGGVINALSGTTRHSGERRNPASTSAAALDPGMRRGEETGMDKNAGSVVRRKGEGHPPYALTDDAVSANQRLARVLGKRKGIGDLDRFTTDAINTDGDKAVYEVGDLIRQVRDTDLAQADELLDKTKRGIAPANVRLLTRIAAADGTDARPVPEPARRDAPVERVPESQDARTPSAPKDKSRPSEGLSGISMDEHGQYHDADGKPIPNPDANPDLQKVQLAPPLLGAAPLPGGAVPASPEDIDKALKNAGDDLDKLARDPVFLNTPLGKAMVMRGMFELMLKGDDASARTDITEPIPDREEFPVDQAGPEGGVLKGRPVESDRAVNPPPFEPPVPDDFDTPPSEDQSGDPDFVGPQVLQAKQSGTWHSRTVPERADEVARKFNEAGISVDARNGVHVIEDHAWHHATRRHGSDGIPLSEEDKERIPEVVRSGRVVEVGVNKHRLPTIVYAGSEGNGNTMYVVEEVRGAGNTKQAGPTFAMKTAYKTKAPPK